MTSLQSKYEPQSKLCESLQSSRDDWLMLLVGSYMFLVSFSHMMKCLKLQSWVSIERTFVVRSCNLFSFSDLGLGVTPLNAKKQYISSFRSLENWDNIIRVAVECTEGPLQGKSIPNLCLFNRSRRLVPWNYRWNVNGNWSRQWRNRKHIGALALSNA